MNRKGENNPRYGKPVSLETREKISNANRGNSLSEEHKKKISDSLKGENNSFYGKFHNKETKNRISEKAKLRYKDTAYKEKMSLLRKGVKLNEEHKKKISQSMRGKKRKPHSEETKRKIAESWIRRKQLKENNG